jgi:dihydrofolate reductase
VCTYLLSKSEGLHPHRAIDRKQTHVLPFMSIPIPMSKLIYHIATTVDHFIAGPQGQADASIFLYEGDHIPDFLTHIQQYNSVLMGGKTYEFGYQFGLQPGEPGYKGIKHYVFSTSLSFNSNAEVELVKENAVEFVRKLKLVPDQKIWLCGGGQLAGSLLDAELIDELILKVNPVVIGEGIPLFGDSRKPIDLHLLDCKTYNSGVVLLSYQIKYRQHQAG